MMPEWAALTPSERKAARRALIFGRRLSDPALDAFVLGQAPKARRAALPLLRLWVFIIFASPLLIVVFPYPATSFIPQWFFWTLWVIGAITGALLWAVYRNLQRLERPPKPPLGESTRSL
jgi:hypothetical protein